MTVCGYSAIKRRAWKSKAALNDNLKSVICNSSRRED